MKATKTKHTPLESDLSKSFKSAFSHLPRRRVERLATLFLPKIAAQRKKYKRTIPVFATSVIPPITAQTQLPITQLTTSVVTSHGDIDCKRSSEAHLFEMEKGEKKCCLLSEVTCPNTSEGFGHFTLKGLYTYTGEYKNHLPHGRGRVIYYFKDGDMFCFEGLFCLGKKEGVGKLTQIIPDKLSKKNEADQDQDRVVYSGEYKEGKFHGIGSLSLGSGSKYEGQFSNNRYNGQGKLSSVTGCNFSGNFRNGNIYGQGAYTFEDEKRVSLFERAEVSFYDLAKREHKKKEKRLLEQEVATRKPFLHVENLEFRQRVKKIRDTLIFEKERVANFKAENSLKERKAARLQKKLQNFELS